MTDAKPKTIQADADDEALLIGALAGDTSAFVALVRRYDSTIRAVAFGVLGKSLPSSMEDATQEGLLKAYRSMGTYKSGTSFKAWLCRIVHNTAIDELRKSRKIVSLVDEESPDTKTTLAETAVARLDVATALKRLPDKQRIVVMLVDGQGFDYPTVARILDIPVGTVASRVNTARTALRVSLAIGSKDNQ